MNTAPGRKEPGPEVQGEPRRREGGPTAQAELSAVFRVQRHSACLGPDFLPLLSSPQPHGAAAVFTQDNLDSISSTIMPSSCWLHLGRSNLCSGSLHTRPSEGSAAEQAPPASWSCPGGTPGAFTWTCRGMEESWPGSLEASRPGDVPVDTGEADASAGVRATAQLGSWPHTHGESLCLCSGEAEGCWGQAALGENLCDPLTLLTCFHLGKIRS